MASYGKEALETGAWLWKATFLFFLPPLSIWSIRVVNKVIRAVRFLNMSLSFMDGSYSPEVQSDPLSEVTMVDTFFFTALPLFG